VTLMEKKKKNPGKIPVAIIRRGFLRYVYGLGARALLIFMGFWWIPVETVSTKKELVTLSSLAAPTRHPIPLSLFFSRTSAGAKQGSSWPPGSQVGSGDIIVCNHVSYVEVLYLAFRYCPTFTQIYTKGGPEGKTLVQPVSMYTAISNCFGVPALDATGVSDAVPLETLTSRARKEGLGPVVVFPEATTSNGLGIVKFAPVFKGFADKEAHIQVAGFKFEFNEFSPAFTAGSPQKHFFQLLCQLHNHLEVKFATPAENPSLKTPAAESEAEDREDPLGGQIATTLARLLRLRRVQLTAEDKINFLSYFNERKKGYQAAEKTKQN